MLPALRSPNEHHLWSPQEAEGPALDLPAVRSAIVELLDDDSYDDGSWGPVFVRLAWHAAGTYDNVTNTGGSEGATMRFRPESDWGANAGLHLARAKLEPIKARPARSLCSFI